MNQNNRQIREHLNIEIHACSEKSERASNQDYYGFSDGMSTVLSHGMEYISHHNFFADVSDFLCVIADGVSSADHPENSEEDAPAFLCRLIFSELFYEFTGSGMMSSIAEEINDTMIHESQRQNLNLAAAFAALAVSGRQIRILSIGDCTVFRIRNGKVNILTSFPSYSGLNRYAGHMGRSGSEMAEICYDFCQDNDQYILMTDGLANAFVQHNGMLNIEVLLKQMETDHSARSLLRYASGKSSDNMSACVIRTRYRQV